MEKQQEIVTQQKSGGQYQRTGILGAGDKRSADRATRASKETVQNLTREEGSTYKPQIKQDS